MMLYMRITNGNPTPLRLESMNVAIPDIGRHIWQTLTPIWFAGQRIYLPNPDEHHMSLVEMDDLRFMLSKSDIQPHNSVEGWVFFEYPRTFIGSDFSRFRITTTDVEGNSIEVEKEPPVKAQGGLALAAIRVPTGKPMDDLSGAYKKLYSEPN